MTRNTDTAERDEQFPEHSDLQRIMAEAFEQMASEELAPTDYDVYVECGELWANIWFTEDAETALEARKERAMEIVKERIRTAETSLPVTVNANYQIDATETGIACWWH